MVALKESQYQSGSFAHNFYDPLFGMPLKVLTKGPGREYTVELPEEIAKVHYSNNRVFYFSLNQLRPYYEDNESYAETLELWEELTDVLDRSY